VKNEGEVLQVVMSCSVMVEDYNRSENYS